VSTLHHPPRHPQPIQGTINCITNNSNEILYDRITSTDQISHAPQLLTTLRHDKSQLHHSLCRLAGIETEFKFTITSMTRVTSVPQRAGRRIQQPPRRRGSPSSTSQPPQPLPHARVTSIRGEEAEEERIRCRERTRSKREFVTVR